ncbi:TonB-dependent receptor [Gluconobacter japonicus]|uniref:TonB-dependent receptor n=1 Tax=Gluconobacter japonicus TaxID=376620 RepID=A0A9Q2FMC9_GLUJA|nr:TonB-dependent receptor [Gluconobacter japonicus]MBF0870941.1 TonB-dependent receptor [Gluconobacter japonicus]
MHDVYTAPYRRNALLGRGRIALVSTVALLPFWSVAAFADDSASTKKPAHVSARKGEASPSKTAHIRPASKPQDHEASRVENVVVTSERKADSPQNIGTSISVISAKMLENRNINNVFDLQYATPSLQIQPSYGSGQFTYTIRGVGFNNYSSNNSPTVGIYIDEVANPVPFGINGMMFDMQRVEVLRGPQGTLYGRNTTGGAINYITNKPTDKLTGGVAAQYGRFDSAKIDGYISGPINDKLKFRLSGETQQGGAWQYNPEAKAHLGNVDRGAARLLVDYAPSESWKVEWNLHGSRDRSDATGPYAWRPITSLSSTNPMPASASRYYTRWGTSNQFAKETGLTPDQKPYSHIDTGGSSLRIEKHLRDFTITNLASYDYMQRNEYDNFDDSSLSLADVKFNTRASVVSDELRFSSNTTGRLHWIGGIYYGYQWLNDRYQSGFEALYNTDGDVRYSQTVNTISGFGQVTYNLTPKLQLVGGLRVEHEKRTLDNVYAHYLVNGVVTNPQNTVAQQGQSYTLPSAKFSVQYHPFSHDMAYFTFSKGVKSGGFTVYNSSDVTQMTNPFKPEQLYAFEVGNKLILPRYNLRINADFFYYDYFDRQVQSIAYSPTTGSAIGLFVNAPRSHMFGGEYEVEWSPIPGLRVAQSGAYVEGAYDEFSAVTSSKRVNGVWVGVKQDVSGRSVEVPHFTANGSVDYTWRLGRYDLVSGVDYSLRTTSTALNDANTIPGYTLWGGYISFAPRKGHWKIEGIGRNITNKHYDVTRGYFVGGDNIAVAGRPATWEVRVRADF